jgi:antitoxin MazE
MIVKLIPIGNSMGLRLPKALIKQLGLDKGRIEIQVEKNGLLIKSVSKIPPVEEWEPIFSAAIAKGEVPEGDLFGAAGNAADKSEWTW